MMCLAASYNLLGLRGNMKKRRNNSINAGPHLVLGAIIVDDARRFILDCVNLPWAIGLPRTRHRFEDWVKRWKDVFIFESRDDNGALNTKQISKEWLQRFA